MNFLIQDYSNQNFPSFQKPQIIGYFSLTGQRREYSQDLSQLKYYDGISKKSVHFDLNQGFDNTIRRRQDLDERIDHLLTWIIQNHLKIRCNSEKKWLKPDFITYRGLLTKICHTPYENRDPWIICAAKLYGTIYLCAFDTEEQKYQKNNRSEKDIRFTSWGYKFEQYILTNSPNSKPNFKKPLIEAEEFNCVFNTKLGHNALLFGAEMDGVETKEIIEEPVDWSSHSFIEAKTNRVVQNFKQDCNYKKKLLKWWCQSFLVGIEKIVCGTRDDKGKVFDVEELKVADMPKSCKKQWSANCCMNFCDVFLNHIKTVVTRDCNECIYKFEYKLGKMIEIEVLPTSSPFAFLPQWYIDEAKKAVNSQF